MSAKVAQLENYLTAMLRPGSTRKVCVTSEGVIVHCVYKIQMLVLKLNDLIVIGIIVDYELLCVMA